MKEIPSRTLDSGLIICLAASSMCPYTSTCANHNSAGDFRTEEGFTPNLSWKPNSNGFRECVTADVMKTWGGGCVPMVGTFGSGALCTDGSTCAPPLPFDDVEPVERTFREALNDARDALDEAWGKMPTGEVGRINDRLDGWSVQRLLATSRQNLIYLVDHLDGWQA